MESDIPCKVTVVSTRDPGGYINMRSKMMPIQGLLPEINRDSS